MKICAVTTWPPHKDGIALYSFELYNHVSKLTDVVVVANSQNKDLGGYHVNGLKVFRCWRRGPAYLPKIFLSILRIKPDIIHIQHGWLLYGDRFSSIFFPFLLILLRLTRRPIIVTMHTVIERKEFMYNNNFFVSMAVFLVSKFIVKFSDVIIVHNNIMKKVLLNEYGLSDKSDKIVVIPHGVKRASENPSTSFRSDRPRILSLGFLRRDKNIEVLIGAFKKFLEFSPEAKLIIVGGRHEHDNEDYFEELLNSLPKDILNNLLFTGFVDEETLDKILLTCDMIVLMSSEKSYIEASGALARIADYGKPIICSRVPKFEYELMHGYNCIMVNPDCDEELFNALILLNFDDKIKERIGFNLKNRFKNRYWSSVAHEHFNLYRKVKFNLYR